MTLALVYTLAGGAGLGSRNEVRPPPLSIESVERTGLTEFAVTVRNNQTYPLRGEVDGSRTPLMAPGEKQTVVVELSALPGRELRARETLAYADETRFERSRITPPDVWKLEESR